MSEHVYLPALLQEIAEVAGLGAALAIAEAKGGERLEPGCVYVAPGGRHLVVEGTRAGAWHTRWSAA